MTCLDFVGTLSQGLGVAARVILERLGRGGCQSPAVPAPGRVDMEFRDQKQESRHGAGIR